VMTSTRNPTCNRTCLQHPIDNLLWYQNIFSTLNSKFTILILSEAPYISSLLNYFFFNFLSFIQFFLLVIAQFPHIIIIQAVKVERLLRKAALHLTFYTLSAHRITVTKKNIQAGLTILRAIGVSST
jgi:hypothetical protein